MGKNVINKFKNISLFNVVKTCNLIVMFIYWFMYLFVFQIWDTYKSPAMWKHIYFSDNIRNAMFYVGMAFTFCCVNYALISARNKRYRAAFGTLLSFLQIGVILCSGMTVLNKDLSVANAEFPQNGVGYCHDLLWTYGIVIVVLMVSIVCSICLMVKKTKSAMTEKLGECISKKENKKYIEILLDVNSIVIVSVIILYVIVSMCNTNVFRSEDAVNISDIIRDYVPKIFDELCRNIMIPAVPFISFLSVFERKCIKSVMYHGYVFKRYEYSYWDIDGRYFIGIKVIIGIFIAMAIWKYLIRSIIKKEKLKKTVYTGIEFAVSVVMILMCIFIQNHKEVKYGTYYNDVRDSWVEIKEDGTFSYVTSMARSSTPSGKYVIEDDELILNSNLKRQYRFEIKYNKIIIKSYDGIRDSAIELDTEFEWEGL